MSSKAAQWAALQSLMAFKDDEGDVIAEAWIDPDAGVCVRLVKVDKLSAAQMVKLCRWGLETLEGE